MTDIFKNLFELPQKFFFLGLYFFFYQKIFGLPKKKKKRKKMKKKQQYEEFLKQFYFTPNGSFNFFEFDLFFIKKEINVKPIITTSKRKKLKKQNKTVSLEDNIKFKKNDNNLFLNFQSVEEEEFFLIKPQVLKVTSEKGEYYPYWLPEDEKYFKRSSILTLKRECVTCLPDGPFLLLQNKEDLLKVPMDEIPKLRNKIEGFINHTEILKGFEYKPLSPQVQYLETIKNNPIYFSEIDKFFYDTFYYCSLGTENKELGIVEVDELNEKETNSKKKNPFDYKLNFEKIKKYII